MGTGTKYRITVGTWGEANVSKGYVGFLEEELFLFWTLNCFSFWKTYGTMSIEKVGYAYQCHGHRYIPKGGGKI